MSKDYCQRCGTKFLGPSCCYTAEMNEEDNKPVTSVFVTVDMAEFKMMLIEYMKEDDPSLIIGEWLDEVSKKFKFAHKRLAYDVLVLGKERKGKKNENQS